MLSIKGIMHYQTFNRSCSYAALANLIEDFNLNFEDKEILNNNYVQNLAGNRN